jgi:rSAM/selenodomain-associated transferase 2
VAHYPDPLSTGSARLSIVIPTLNEAAAITDLLSELQPLRDVGHEVIVADGGSTDDTVALANSLADRVLSAPRGRARQMNAGAGAAQNPVLWFLHADSHVPEQAAAQILRHAASEPGWGRFDVRLSGRQWLLRIVERMMNWRSCLTGIATGDQGIYVARTLFDAVGGYPEISLMEDIALSKSLRRLVSPACIHTPRLETSSRRWEKHGILRTIVLMWRLRLAYALGADPDRLARRYR